MFGGDNKKHGDIININIDRDYQPDSEGDIAMAQPGMRSLKGGVLVEKRGIEVGNIFQLGYHYTKLMTGADYTDSEGTRQPYYMGCYGIGIGRTMAAIVEAFHDEKGIMWPESVAPADVVLVRLGADEAVIKAADMLNDELEAAGKRVIYDDRDESAGKKFADADLIGVPLRITISARTLESQSVEYKRRNEFDMKLVKLSEVASM
jgi:prolyl-tRNA synthetase